MQPPVVKTVWTHADFDGMNWHDNYIHAFTFDVEEAEWKSDLVLDIDYIAEWVCSGDTFKWWIAPATLTFHNVTDPVIGIQWAQSGYRASMHPVSIGAITREMVSDQKICLDAPYYKWRIEINWPAGEITFGASGFAQALRKPLVLSDSQLLPPSARPA